MNFSDNAEAPLGITEENIESHIMGVMLIKRFNMKKGIDIFGDRAETAVIK